MHRFFSTSADKFDNCFMFSSFKFQRMKISSFQLSIHVAASMKFRYFMCSYVQSIKLSIKCYSYSKSRKIDNFRQNMYLSQAFIN